MNAIVLLSGEQLDEQQNKAKKIDKEQAEDIAKASKQQVYKYHNLKQ